MYRENSRDRILGVNYLLVGCADEYTLETMGREILPIFAS